VSLDRITVTKAEAARMLGVSVATLERHILADLRVIYAGRKVLVPVRELRRWAEEHAIRLTPV
jgi:hypothetical protein